MFKTMDKRPMPGLEMQIKSKLAYEWKNIYRSLAQVECDDGTIKAKDLQNVCNKFQVNLTKEESKKI